MTEISDNSIDLIVSNCVVNLCPNKKDVFSEAFRVLKPGGEMYFSDVYSDRRIPEKLLHDPVLHGECLSGALYWNDFLSLVKSVGFKSPRLVKDSIITIQNEDIEKKLDLLNFSVQLIDYLKYQILIIQMVKIMDLKFLIKVPFQHAPMHLVLIIPISLKKEKNTLFAATLIEFLMKVDLISILIFQDLLKPIMELCLDAPIKFHSYL